jgi:chromate transporter
VNDISAPRTGSPGEQAAPPALSYWELFRRFLRFGFLAWGGPVAQIAMIRHELVDEERWVSSGRFNRVLAIYQVLPGPEAHELCVYFGMLARGRLGGLLAGLGFMLPGFLLMFALSWLYFAIGIRQSLLAAFFLGVQPAVIALIVRAVHRIGSHVLLDAWLWAIAVVSAVAALLGVSFWITLPTAGLLYALALGRQYIAAAAVLGLTLVVIIGTGMLDRPAEITAASVPPHAPRLIDLFLSGLKAGLLTFGGAYTVIPFLRDDAVGHGWMSDAQFLDGLALSGILPAPLIIFSTFVGYFGGGPPGALAMTVGIFLPAFCFTLYFHDQLERIVDHGALHRFLEGVSAGVVGLIAATTLELGYTTAQSTPALLAALAIFMAALALLYAWRAKTAVLYIVFGAGLAGLVTF